MCGRAGEQRPRAEGARGRGSRSVLFRPRFALLARAPIAAALAALLLCSSAGPAVAADPPPAACPDAPEVYAPADAPDPVVAELRELRREAAKSCAAQLDAIERVRTKLGAVGFADGQAVDLSSPVELARGATAADPLHVQVPADSIGSVSLDDESRAALVDASTATAGTVHADVWWGWGLICALFFGYFLLRLVLPRA